MEQSTIVNTSNNKSRCMLLHGDAVDKECLLLLSFLFMVVTMCYKNQLSGHLFIRFTSIL